MTFLLAALTGGLTVAAVALLSYARGYDAGLKAGRAVLSDARDALTRGAPGWAVAAILDAWLTVSETRG